MHIFFNFFSHSSFHIPLPLRFTSPAAAPHTLPHTARKISQIRQKDHTNIRQVTSAKIFILEKTPTQNERFCITTPP